MTPFRMVSSQWEQLIHLRKYRPNHIDHTLNSFRRYTGDFTNVIVPPTSTTSWSIPCDEIKYLAYGVPQTMKGLVASIDLYRSRRFPHLVRTLGADPSASRHWHPGYDRHGPLTLRWCSRQQRRFKHCVVYSMQFDISHYADFWDDTFRDK